MENENRKREHKTITRVGCETSLRIELNKQINKCIMMEFMGDHNHPLVEPKIPNSFNPKGSWGMHIRLNWVQCVVFAWELDKLWITWCNNQMDILMWASQRKKDLYNHVNVDCKVQIRNGDTKGTLSYLCGKA